MQSTQSPRRGSQPRVVPLGTSPLKAAPSARVAIPTSSSSGSHLAKAANDARGTAPGSAKKDESRPTDNGGPSPTKVSEIVRQMNTRGRNSSVSSEQSVTSNAESTTGSISSEVVKIPVERIDGRAHGRSSSTTSMSSDTSSTSDASLPFKVRKNKAAASLPPAPAIKNMAGPSATSKPLLATTGVDPSKPIEQIAKSIVGQSSIAGQSSQESGRVLERIDSKPSLVRSDASSGDLNILGHRGKVVEEILSSERVFLGLLQDFLECYYVALCAEREQASMDFMSRSALVGLCSNIEQISAVSQQLLSELTHAATVSGDPSQAQVGEVFLCTSSLLKLYGQYAENHSAARHDIQAMVQSPAFRAFWDRTETDAMLGRGPGTEPPRMPSTSATLDGYLILPIQRVPRYLLLLREVQKTTPRDLMKEENEALDRAIAEVGNAAKFMNECIWKAEQKEILRDLQSKFVGTVVDFIGGVGLAGYRALVFEGELVRVTSKNAHRAYYFHLMNDAIVYSRATGSGGFRFHRALNLNGSCSVSEFPVIANPGYEVYTNGSKLSCAFKISTLEKSFVVYAATPELKRQWMDAISGVIKTQASLERQAKQAAEEEERKRLGVDDSGSGEAGDHKEEAATAPTLQGAADKCQMCRATLFIFTRRLNCERCGLLVCGTCGSNHRVLPNKLKTKQLRTTLPVCCACAWEMDGTAVDANVDEFRIKLWVEDVQSLVGAVGGHAIVESAGDKQNKRHYDAVEALKRLYFSVSSKHNLEERFRGPSNAGILGADAAFSVPIGLPSDESLAGLTLHVHMVGVGEIGRVPIRLDNIITQPEVTRAQPFFKWHVVSPNPNTTAVSTLAITLIQNTKNGMHLKLSDKERGALRIGLKICFELHVPPSLWGAHFKIAERNRSNSSSAMGRARGSSVATNRPGVLKAMNNASEQQDDVAVRLRRFMSLDDPAYTIGGTNVDKSEGTGLREKLNVSLLTDYERRVIRNPTFWGLTLADTLYSDCLAHFGAMAKTRSSLYSDTQLTLLNRLRVFHSTAEIAAIIQSKPKLEQASVTPAQKPMTSPVKRAPHVLERDNEDILRQAADRQASQMEGRRPSRNIEISLNALDKLAREQEKRNRRKNGEPKLGESVAEEEEEEEDPAEEERQDNDDRVTILRELFESEKAYLEDLSVLDEVFVTRLTQVAQGSDIRLATQKKTDVWAEKMGLSGATPTMTTGIQAMNTGILGRAKSMIQRSPSKLFSKELFARASPGGESFRSPGKSTSPEKRGSQYRSGATGADAEDDDDDVVRNVLKQPFVTVLMQSVKQIRTVNQEFCNSLAARVDGKTLSPETCVGDILERFAGVMPVYSTYASHQPFALEELTNARTEEEGWDARWSMGARANSKSLDALLTACEADPRCQNRTLKTFLTIPLERVETYRSALSALLMCTPRCHPDWNRMRLALGKIVESTKHMTRAVRRRENLERLREIDAMVEDWPPGFQLVEPKRWLVREGCLIERQTFAKRETHRARYFWLFSDCIIMATKVTSHRKSIQTKLRSLGASGELLSHLGGVASSLISQAAPETSSGKGPDASVRRYRFKRLINIADMTICDLPHGVQSGSSGLILGDPFFAFCIASVSSPSFVALVPNNPADCQSKAGPAPVELARVGPPPAHSLITGESAYGRLPVVYDKAAVKNAWISDILLCIELFQRKAAFDDDDGIQQIKAANTSKMAESSATSFKRSVPVQTSQDMAGLSQRTPSPKDFAVENPTYSPNPDGTIFPAISRTTSSSRVNTSGVSTGDSSPRKPVASVQSPGPVQPKQTVASPTSSVEHAAKAMLSPSKGA